MSATYYQVLEVDRLASPDVIEAAYRRLALRYHPDRNPTRDTLGKMQEINEAYAVLRDPVKRQQYDRTIDEVRPSSGGASTHSSEAASGSYRQADVRQSSVTFACHSCGCINTSLRVAAFPYVVSLLIVTFRNSWSGIYCRKCRYSETLKAKLITLFLGWWGIPFGPFRTLSVLFGSDDGFVPAEPNAEFLKHLGLFFLSRGDTVRARKAFADSLGYLYDKELDFFSRTVLGAINSDDGDDQLDDPGRWGGRSFMTIAAVLTAAALLLWGINQWSSPGSTPDIPPRAAASSQLPTRAPSVSRRPTSTPRPTTTPVATATRQPEPTPSPVPEPVLGQIRSGVLRLYESPNRQARQPGAILRPGQKFEVMGQYADCAWIQIVTKAGAAGWLPVDDERIILTAECQSLPPAHFRPETSIVFAKSGRDDFGRLDITNSSSSDTLVYVAEEKKPPVAVAYVRAEDSFTIGNIADGVYFVYMRSGAMWNGTNFMLGNLKERFEEPFDFTTELRGDGYYTSVWEITLEPLIGGNAPVETVYDEAFPEIPTEVP